MKNEVISIIFLLLILIPVTIIDIKTKRIPDVLTYSGIILIFFIKTFIESQAVFLSLILIGSGFIPFFLIWYFTKGKLGLGDAKLSAFLALVLGLRGWFLMLFLSSSIALIFAVTMLICKRMDKQARIPYAPFLSIGAIGALFLI